MRACVPRPAKGPNEAEDSGQRRERGVRAVPSCAGWLARRGLMDEGQTAEEAEPKGAGEGEERAADEIDGGDAQAVGQQAA